jgi:hypothetical protein
LLAASFNLSPVPQTNVQEKGLMNARSVLDDDLRKKVAHLDVEQIKNLTAKLEQQVWQLKTFLKVSADQKTSRSPGKTDCSPPARPRLWN